jgi:hypothetical protein
MEGAMQWRSAALYGAVGYAAVLSTLVAAGAIGGPREAAIDTLNVRRINVREPDGTLRLVVSDRAEFPGIIVRGKEIPHASRRDSAGMIFFNDEGTENGGLIFGGARKAGVVSSFGHLSFDQYEQDQVAFLEQTETAGEREAGLKFADRPDQPLDFRGLSALESEPDSPAKQAKLARLKASGAFGQPRLFVGKSERNAVLALRDAQGRKRLVLTVTAAGDASIQFLDAAGKVVRTVTPQS